MINKPDSRCYCTDRPVIFVGSASCGMSAGAARTIGAIREYLSSNGIIADVVETGCIGLCSSEPIVDIMLPGKNRLSFGRITADKVHGLLTSVLRGNIPVEDILGQHPGSPSGLWDRLPNINDHTFFRLQARNVLKNCGLTNPADINDYIARGGFRALDQALNHHKPDNIIFQIYSSGLKDRQEELVSGKLLKTLNLHVKQKYIVCNASVISPGDFASRIIIESDPFMLIEGIALAAYASGASKAIISTAFDSSLVNSRLDQALSQCKPLGITGKNIFGSGFNLDIIIKKTAPTVLNGDDSSILRGIEGQRPTPKPAMEFYQSSLVFGKPVVVETVETFAQIKTVLENRLVNHSPENPKKKLTKLLSLSGDITFKGLVEVPADTLIKTVIFDIGGATPTGKNFKFVQAGGPAGVCLPLTSHTPGQAPGADPAEAIRALASSASLVAMDDNKCIVDLIIRNMEILHSQCCGKCTPCREGGRQMLEILNTVRQNKSMAKGRAELERFRSVMQLKSLAHVVQDASLCRLGRSSPNFLLSALKNFREEFDIHIYKRQCPSGVCRDLLLFSINEDACKGCNTCSRHCTANAIMGTFKSPHYILPDKCSACGECLEACPNHAIEVN